MPESAICAARAAASEWAFGSAQGALNFSVYPCQLRLSFYGLLATTRTQHVRDGHPLIRPIVNRLIRIGPPDGKKLDKPRRPSAIVDPGAGHGPVIGGCLPNKSVPAPSIEVKKLWMATHAIRSSPELGLSSHC